MIKILKNEIYVDVKFNTPELVFIMEHAMFFTYAGKYFLISLNDKQLNKLTKIRFPIE